MEWHGWMGWNGLVTRRMYTIIGECKALFSSLSTGVDAREQILPVLNQNRTQIESSVGLRLAVTILWLTVKSVSGFCEAWDA